MSQSKSSAEGSLSLLLPFYLDDIVSGIYQKLGFKVFKADNKADTEKIVIENEPDLALEWQHGRFDFPIRDLLKKHERSTPVILLLNWNSSKPDKAENLGYAGYANPTNLNETIAQFYNALPGTKRRLLDEIVKNKGIGQPIDSTDVIISDEESLSLLRRLNLLREQIGEVPKSFLPKDDSIRGPFYYECPRFDINRFLDVFDRVKLNEGYVLDYFYEADGWGGYPIPFTRKENLDPIPLLRQLSRQKIENKDVFGYTKLIARLLKDVEFEKSASGYFQFAVFDVAIRQFYLFWHACYNDLEFVLSKSRLADLLRNIPEQIKNRLSKNTEPIEHEIFKFTVSGEERSRLNDIALNPQVRMNDDSAKVTMVAFTRWGGFHYDHTYVKWPNTVEKKERNIIVKYDCGIMF